MKIVIIGGGTSGFFTALYAMKMFSDDVTLINSSKIDILGAGEGTTPNIRGAIKSLDIDIDDFMKETGATIKDGINFINWNQNKSDFTHLFEDELGFHMNARKTADYFQRIGISRGLKIIDAIVDDYIVNQNDDINQIVLDNGQKIECDFIFDCSGFARLVIGKFYKSEWVSYSDKLICDKAFGFFLPQTNEVDVNEIFNTKATAMNSGWMWEIPLRERFGCGYVFSSKHTTVENAKKEVEEYIGKKIDIVKIFDFNPGSYKEIWKNNCIALGLAGGFVEPLEATSLMTLVTLLDELYKIGVKNINQTKKDKFNKHSQDFNTQIYHFLIHHYNCGRKDTPFWREISSLELPERNAKMLDENYYLSSSNLTQKSVSKYLNFKINRLVFSPNSYRLVIDGHKIKKNLKTLI
jgi:tryptophan halogenase